MNLKIASMLPLCQDETWHSAKRKKHKYAKDWPCFLILNSIVQLFTSLTQWHTVW